MRSRMGGMRDSTKRRSRWKTFTIGLAIRLLGVALIILGDGHHSWPRKAMVIIGVALTVGGITVLRYLLLAEPLSRLTKRKCEPSGPTQPINH